MADARRRVVVTGEGPILVHGPVDIEMPDGERVHSDRPVTALCACGRTAHLPFCDTSHRRRVRDAERKEDDS
ncbi:CDGSH iron-sulfur domain-containing protein [Nocardiopsis salina]|uniref:CDGSH iron-sulfur domain-containing protein n=1 Tax=Nocardiopsis salina TaxID=245836 RepID=UPI00036D16EF|nr:CDGSH iron-sulfur domain-containing protein [Nocardiopsis salina]